MEEAKERKNFVVCLMKISFFHVFFFSFPLFSVFQIFVPKGETQGEDGSVVPYYCNSPSPPLHHSLCSSPRPPQSILDPWCQL